jgi:hypothetical protein
VFTAKSAQGSIDKSIERNVPLTILMFDRRSSPALREAGSIAYVSQDLADFIQKSPLRKRLTQQSELFAILANGPTADGSCQAARRIAQACSLRLNFLFVIHPFFVLSIDGLFENSNKSYIDRPSHVSYFVGEFQPRL